MTQSTTLSLTLQQDWQTFLALQCCCFYMLSVGQHSAKVDSKVSQMTCLFNHSPMKYDCWLRFARCSFVKSAPQCTCFVWTDERSGIITPLRYAIQLLLHCFRRLPTGSPLVFCI